MNSRSNLLDDLSDEDTTIQVTVTRASKNPHAQSAPPTDPEVDEDWVDEINESIEIRQMTEEEKTEAKKAKSKAKVEEDVATKVESEPEDDVDYWPEDWEDDEEDWED